MHGPILPPHVVQAQHGASVPHLRRRHRRIVPSRTLPIVEGWRLTHRVKEGAVADVYLAQPIDQTRETESDYALKLLRHDVDDLDSAMERLRREATAMNSVQHPNVISLLGSSFSEHQSYLLLPRLRGATLRAVLDATGRFAVAKALWIGRQIAGALDAIHQSGWMHLDVKPCNIAINASGHCTLFDLDLSLPCGGDLPKCSSANCLRGTLCYTAPELFTSCNSAQPASDVYSLGLVLYELLAGRLPFQTSSPAALVRAHREQLPPSLRTFVPQASHELSQLITRMLAKQPERRPSTDGELTDALARLEIANFAVRSA